MKPHHLAILSSALLLTACDAAAPAFNAQVRQTFIAQCQQFAEGNGFAPELVQPVCECGADEFIEGGAANITQIDTARVQEIVTTCAQRIGQPVDGAPAMEDTGA